MIENGFYVFSTGDDSAKTSKTDGAPAAASSYTGSYDGSSYGGFQGQSYPGYNYPGGWGGYQYPAAGGWGQGYYPQQYGQQWK